MTVPYGYAWQRRNAGKVAPPVVWDRQSHFANHNARAGCDCDDHNAVCYVQAAFRACAELEAVPPLKAKIALDDLTALGGKAWFSNNRRVAVVRVRQQDGSESFAIYARQSDGWQGGDTIFNLASEGTEVDMGEVWFIVAKEDASIAKIKAMAERNS